MVYVNDALFLGGLAAILGGIYLVGGLPVTLVIGGAVLMALALLNNPRRARRK